MKNIILSLIVSAFAVTASVQAADDAKAPAPKAPVEATKDKAAAVPAATATAAAVTLATVPTAAAADAPCCTDATCAVPMKLSLVTPKVAAWTIK